MILNMLTENRNNEIATLSSKVRNDRERGKKNNKIKRSENFIFFFNFTTSYNISYDLQMDVR